MDLKTEIEHQKKLKQIIKNWTIPSITQATSNVLHIHHIIIKKVWAQTILFHQLIIELQSKNSAYPDKISNFHLKKIEICKINKILSNLINWNLNSLEIYMLIFLRDFSKI